MIIISGIITQLFNFTILNFVSVLSVAGGTNIVTGKFMFYESKPWDKDKTQRFLKGYHIKSCKENGTVHFSKKGEEK
jgi:hypothetical protein